MKKIITIIKSYFALLSYNFNLLPPNTVEVLNQRMSQCETCPLRKGNWCSKKLYIRILHNKVYKTINGCGCFLPAKLFSEINEVNDCPRKMWKSFE